MTVHHAGALFDGPFHQGENLAPSTHRPPKTEEDFVPPLLMDVLQLGFGLIMGFVGVLKPVVFGGGVVKHPVGATVTFGGARRHDRDGQNQTNRGRFNIRCM